jgi:hypothetical protein
LHDLTPAIPKEARIDGVRTFASERGGSGD